MTVPTFERLAAGPMGGIDHAALDRDLFTGTSLKSLVVVNMILTFGYLSLVPSSLQ